MLSLFYYAHVHSLSILLKNKRLFSGLKNADETRKSCLHYIKVFFFKKGNWFNKGDFFYYLKLFIAYWYLGKNSKKTIYIKKMNKITLGFEFIDFNCSNLVHIFF